jgi:hypothetical protein
MWRQGATFPGKRIVKVCIMCFEIEELQLIACQAGTLDDTSILDNYKVDVELFAKTRPKWVGAQQGATQKDTMS